MISIWQSERETDIEICLLQTQMVPRQGQNSANRLSPANQTQLGSGEKYSFLTISQQLSFLFIKILRSSDDIFRLVVERKKSRKRTFHRKYRVLH